MDDALTTYFAAWNEPDADQRRRLLERCVTDDAQRIIDAQNRHVMEGLDVAERIDDGRLQPILMFHGPLPAAE